MDQFPSSLVLNMEFQSQEQLARALEQVHTLELQLARAPREDWALMAQFLVGQVCSAEAHPARYLREAHLDR